mgnify:CR=1 FL=1
MPGALVRYGKRAAYLAAPMPYKRARMAYGVARHVYTNRGRYKRAARVIGRAYRRYRRSRLMGRIGQPPGLATTKRRQQLINTENVNTLTLYQTDLTAIPHTTTNQINDRQRDVINLRGFRICWDFWNQGAFPALCNVAVVYDRQNDFPAGTTDFFRGNGATRATDFSTLQHNAQQFHCLPLNKDRFTILTHKRFELDRTVGGGFNGATRMWKTMKFYVPLKKQIRYEDDEPNSRILLLYWFSHLMQATGTAAAPTGIVQIKTITYFKEPK